MVQTTRVTGCMIKFLGLQVLWERFRELVMLFWFQELSNVTIYPFSSAGVLTAQRPGATYKLENEEL